MSTLAHIEAPPSPNPLEDARAQLAEAVEILGYDAGFGQKMAAPGREVTVSLPLRRDDGSMENLIGYRVQHDVSRGAVSGGLRFSPHVDLDELSCAGYVDDLEMRPCRSALRRCQRGNTY